MQFERPNHLPDALALLQSQRWDILSGGTDYYPSLRDEPPKLPILDISAIAALREIGFYDGYWKIGALATWTDVIRADLPAAFDALKLAAREVGSVQIQNRATLAGNLCNASPAADGVPPLLILDAEVEIASADQTRRVPLSQFILGNRRTALGSDEMVTGVLLPDNAANGTSSFLKLGARKYLVISIAMVAARLSVEAGRVTHAAVSVGSCSEVAKRLSALEGALIGRTADDLAAAVTVAMLGDLSPISDVRATDAYRQTAARELVCRTLQMALS